MGAKFLTCDAVPGVPEQHTFGTHQADNSAALPEAHTVLPGHKQKGRGSDLEQVPLSAAGKLKVNVLVLLDGPLNGNLIRPCTQFRSRSSTALTVQNAMSVYSASNSSRTGLLLLPRLKLALRVNLPP